MDDDQDGFLSMEELRSQTQPVDEEEPETDEDGNPVSLVEEEKSESFESGMNRADTDQDGKISLAEMLSHAQDTDAEWNEDREVVVTEFFGHLDADKDGFLS